MVQVSTWLKMAHLRKIVQNRLLGLELVELVGGCTEPECKLCLIILFEVGSHQ